MTALTRRGFLRVGAFAGAAALSGALFGCAQESGSQSAQSAGGSESGSTSAAGSAFSASAAGAPQAGKTLVAFYSAQGHTRRVAQTIADELGADLFEIAPEELYTDADLNWSDSESRVTREHEDESLRDIPLAQTAPDGFAEYDTVVLGYPIWWAVAAWPTNRFASDNDFSGKRVVAFCTSSSSGLGQSVNLLAQAAGSGDWAGGMRFSSSAEEDEVRTWARSL